MARKRSEREIRLSPEFQCMRLLIWSIVFFIFGPIFIWLALYTCDQSDVTCSIQSFYVPALRAAGANTSADYTIYFDLMLQNEQDDMGVYYDDLNITFHLYDQNKSSMSQIANYTVKGFYQGHKKNAHRIDHVHVDAHEMSWASNPIFRVNLATSVRFKDMAWKSKRRNLTVGADVEVDSVTGKKVNKEGIVLEFDSRVLHILKQRASIGLILWVTVLLLLCCWPCCCCFLAIGVRDIKEKLFSREVEAPSELV